MAIKYEYSNKLLDCPTDPVLRMQESNEGYFPPDKEYLGEYVGGMNCLLQVNHFREGFYRSFRFKSLQAIMQWLIGTLFHPTTILSGLRMIT